MMPAALLTAALLLPTHPMPVAGMKDPATLTYIRAEQTQAARSLTYLHRLDEIKAEARASALAASIPRVVPDPAPAGGISAVWQRVAACESGGNWADTAGLYEGGVQFLNSTWLADGGGRYAEHAYDATSTEQLTIARVALASGGVSQWPVCGPKAGLQQGD